MRIINVLKTDRGMISESYSYIITDEEKSSDVIVDAEQMFMDLIREEEGDISEEDLSEYVDAGNYTNYDGISIDIYFSDQIIQQ
jgi:hypothetical protein